jgi:LmbE family N-acetylglucosaminyl deacetylase
MYRMPIIIFLLLAITNLNYKKIESPKIIMAVFAHPDDESFISPLLAKYAAGGNKIFLVLATNGEKGARNYTGIPAGDSLAKKRQQEAACASTKLNIQPPIFLGMNDGELDVDFTGAPLRKKIDSVFNIYKPDIVITWGPDGGYGHLDHRMVHNVVTELFQSGLSPFPKSLFYGGIPSSRWQQKPVFKTGMLNFFHNAWKPVSDEYLTTRIKCSVADWEKGFQALQCHWSQFTTDEMEELKEWMKKMNNDTIYLRPFAHKQKISYTIK